MRAITVHPGRAGSVAIEDVPEPYESDGSVLVQTAAIGICGTDREIIAGAYGDAPAGQERLVIGHESVGRVLEAPADSALHEGDWVVGIVRRPDPVPCRNCAAGEWDMCSNGRYTERGIRGLHGFASERFRSAPEFLVRGDPSLGLLNVLVEPASVIVKAWEHIERIGQRALWAPERVLVTGAGPIGLLAALAAAQKGFEVHVLDRVVDGPKPAMVRALGARYHHGPIETSVTGMDIVVECTGASALFLDVIQVASANGVVCLTGVSSGGRQVSVDTGLLNREIVLENNVVFGTVNANRRHYEAAVQLLAGADRSWLEGLITARVALDDWRSAYAQDGYGIKTVLLFS